MCSFDSPILFSPQFFFFFFFFYDFQLSLSLSIDTIRAQFFAHLNNANLRKMYPVYRQLLGLRVVFVEMGNSNPRSPSSLIAIPSIHFLNFQFHHPIVIPLLFRLVRLQLLASETSWTSVVYHGGHRRFRRLSGAATSDLRETRPLTHPLPFLVTTYYTLRYVAIRFFC